MLIPRGELPPATAGGAPGPHGAGPAQAGPDAEPHAADVSPSALPAVLDVEASGFGAGSFPIEIGWVLPDGRARCTLVRPEPDWTHWDGRAEQVHGIARHLLDDHGRPARAVARMLNDDLAGTVVYCDGWAHDYPWIARLFDAAGMQPHFRLEAVTRLLDDAGLARLRAAHALTRAAQGRDRHRASSDARALQLALQQALAPAAPDGSASDGPV